MSSYVKFVEDEEDFLSFIHNEAGLKSGRVCGVYEDKEGDGVAVIECHEILTKLNLVGLNFEALVYV